MRSTTKVALLAAGLTLIAGRGARLAKADADVLNKMAVSDGNPTVQSVPYEPMANLAPSLKKELRRSEGFPTKGIYSGRALASITETKEQPEFRREYKDKQLQGILREMQKSDGNF